MIESFGEYEIHDSYLPGCIGRIAELHALYYHAHWDFGLFFEAKVASELAQFMSDYDPVRDGIWLAVRDGRVEGSVILDGSEADSRGAHLRWFILSDNLRGHGVGRQLLDRAMAFNDVHDYARCYLWTFQGLGAAKALYESCGFRLAHEQLGAQWGAVVTEQLYEWE